MKWTDEQAKAINEDAHGGNILVSAAAGSGKTAVLVERVLRKIIDGDTSIDRLLIVTFTEAAAAEMREKIIKRLIKETDDGKHSVTQQRMLKNQIRLADSADIMTIDAFCSRVVRNNFHILGTDPNAAIADEAMAELLKNDAINKVLDRLYKTDDTEEQERFERLLEAYASDRGDTGLIELVFEIYKFITSFADPKKWLEDAAAIYRGELSELPYVKYLKNVSVRAAKNCILAIDEFLEQYGNEEIAAEYAGQIKSIAEDINSSLSWDEIYGIYKSEIKQPSARAKIKPLLWQDIPIGISSGANERLLYIKSTFLDMAVKGITVPFEHIEQECDMNMLADEADDIVWLVEKFIDEFDRIKDRRALKEFSDIEHLAYMLFRDHEDIRTAYRDKYDEILIDEYQDTNGLQDEIFRLISDNNIFMVGDLKQSIYRFRGGDPYIFKYKSENYDSDDTGDIKITLSQNFRSRIEILNSVNDIFSCVMSVEAGDVEYKGTERIVRQSDYYPEEGSGKRAELHYIMVKKSDETDKAAEEIDFTAKKIREILDSGISVYDKDNDCCRPVQMRDIVILENSVKGNGEEIVKRLEEYNINAYVQNETFFERREIKTILSLLSVINNAHQDIPFISVLRSPIGGFSDEELARIRVSMPKKGGFYEAFCRYARSGFSYLRRGIYKYVSGIKADTGRRGKRNSLKSKCMAFCRDLSRWRSYVRSKSVASLIWSLYEETYFYDMMGAIDGNEESQLNLRLLYERAMQYESAGFRGLFNFIRYISSIESREGDISGAVPIGENNDVVRIMTIHKSKGLEFPFVFIIGAGKQFKNFTEGPFIRLHKDLGIGLPYIHYDEHYMRDSEIKALINEVNKREQTSERMRLLYVALTRARERLFVVISCNEKNEDATEESVKKGWEKMLIDGKMLPSASLAAKGFFGWLCPAAYANPDTWSITFHTPSKTEDETVNEEKNNTYEESKELRDEVFKILDYKYKYPQSSLIPSRTSVTRLKEMSMEQDDVVYEPQSRSETDLEGMAELMYAPLSSKPAFMNDKGSRPASEVGTLYHRVVSELDMELLREHGAECVADELKRLTESGIITEEDGDFIDESKIKRFAESDICRRMAESRELHREEPFQINIPASEYDPAIEDSCSNEKIILQGIIDCFFAEDDGYVLVDFKTDKVGRGGAAEIRHRYNKQLELYSRAIENLTGMPVKESMLYLFDTDETV